MAARRGFGAIRQLPSKRWQASYIGPDGARHLAPETFTAKVDAEGWLAGERRRIEYGEWVSPADQEIAERARELAERQKAERDALTLRSFVYQDWLPELELRPTTRRDYDGLLRNHIMPELGDRPLLSIDRATVRVWWGHLDKDKPRARSKAYQLLHNVFNGAMDADLITVNPAVLPKKKAARPKRAKKIEPLTVDQLDALAEAMPERLRMAVLLGCWCALRYGELAELRRSDLDLNAGLLRVSRGVVKVAGGYVVGQPKTEAGVRSVHVPAFLLPELRQHLTRHAAWGSEGLLFPAPNGGHLHPSSFARAFAKAALAAGRPDATPHTLRHTGASLATSAGATTADVMARLGHTTPSMAMVYQHSMAGADAKVADNLSRLATPRNAAQ